MTRYNPKIHNRRSIRLKGYDYSKAGLYFITICCQDRICRFGDVKNGEMILNEFGIIAYNEWIKLAERFANFELDVFQIMPNHIHGIISLLPVGSRLALDPENSVEDIVIENDESSRLALDPENKFQNIIIKNEESSRLALDPENNFEENPVASGLAPDELIIDGQPQNIDGQPRGLPQPEPQGLPQLEPRGLPQRKNPSIPDIVGAYKSLVANGCLEIYKFRDEVMGKFWQRNYYEHIIRNEFAYYNISEYIINNPIKWEEDRFYFPKI